MVDVGGVFVMLRSIMKQGIITIFSDILKNQIHLKTEANL